VGEFQESLVNESEAFEADAQSAEVVKPRDGSLDDPEWFAQTTAVRLTANLDAFISIADGQDAIRRCGAAAPGPQRRPLAPRRNHHFR